MASVIEVIAQELNVSTATVSRALNDRPGVSEKLRARILDKARELNYAPSATARGLATSQTFAVGFFVREKPGLPTHSDPFYGEILHGAEQAFAQSDYHLTIATLTDDILENPQRFRFTRQRRIDGMILAGPDIMPDFILAMQHSGTPMVLVDNQLEHTQAHCVNSDDEDGGYLAARHLLDKGHTQIGVISGPTYWPSNRRRVNGYRRAINEAGLNLPVVYMERTTIDSGQEAFTQLVERAPEVTAVCAVNDSMAIGAIRAARQAGIDVPGQLSVIGFDDIEWARLNDPPLTTVHVSKRQMGAEAAQRLMALFGNSELAPTELTIAVRLVERASSAEPPIRG